MIPPEFLHELAKERGISETEVEVLDLALNGETNTAAIAERLDISPEAVRKRLSEVYKEFDIEGVGPGKLARLQQKLVSLYQERQTSSPLSYNNVHDDGEEVSANPHLDWEKVPESGDVYGRTDELKRLIEWIVRHSCKLVRVWGLGGIGKTTLVAELVKQIRDQKVDKFQDVIWHSLRHATDVNVFLNNIILHLYKKQTYNLPKKTDDKISLLLRLLNDKRYLIVLDDVEVISDSVPAGRYQEGYEKYGELLRRLAEESHKSCLILIGIEKPGEADLLDKRKNSSVQSLELLGLKEEAAKKILGSMGLRDEEEWSKLIKYHQGSPLGLKLISVTIKEVFDNSVKACIEHGTLVNRNISELLYQQFQRLSEPEKDIMYCLAIKQIPVLLSEFEVLISISQVQLFEAIASLKRRSLIQTETNKDGTSFKLQQVISDYITNQLLVEQIAKEISIQFYKLQDKEIQIDKMPLLKRYNLAPKKPGTAEESQDFIIKPINNKLIFEFRNEKLIKNTLNEMQALLQKHSLLEIGYASENICNLLKQLNDSN